MNINSLTHYMGSTKKIIISVKFINKVNDYLIFKKIIIINKIIKMLHSY